MEREPGAGVSRGKMGKGVLVYDRETERQRQIDVQSQTRMKSREGRMRHEKAEIHRVRARGESGRQIHAEAKERRRARG